MAGTLTPTPYQTVLDGDGVAVSGALINTYDAGTTDRATTYTTSDLSVANANPIVADSAGRYVAYLAAGANLRFIITTSADVTIDDQDNVQAVPGAAVNLDVEGTVGEAVTAGQVLYLSSAAEASPLTAGLWYLTDADAAPTSTTPQSLGVAVSAIAINTAGTIRLAGLVTSAGAVVVGTTYYVSATAGAITASAPTLSRQVGVATTTSTLLLAATTAVVGALPNPITQDLLFTDATYDIGKSGATRPRDVFASRNAVIGGTLGVSSSVTAAQVDITGEGDLRLQDNTGGQYVGLDAPSAVSTSYTLTFPAAIGSVDQLLTINNTDGTLQWADAASGDITSVVAGAGMTGGATSGAATLNVIGTADKVTVSADAVTIASTYVGQTSITTLGTIATGTWQGTAVADAYVANDLTISGGTVDNSVIGGSTAAAATVTTLNTTGAVGIGGTPTGNQLLHIEGSDPDFILEHTGGRDIKLGARSGKAMIQDNYGERITFQPTETIINSDGLDFDFRVESDTLTSAFLVTGSSGAVSVQGAFSKGSGSFKIDHPLPAKTDTHHLIHSFIEGPRADLIYRGTVTLIAGSATVDLDTASGMSEGTWVLLCRDEQCFTSNETGWFHVRGSVTGSTLTIDCEESDCTDTVSWMVVANRQDQHIMETDWTDENGYPIVEPEKPAEPEP